MKRHNFVLIAILCCTLWLPAIGQDDRPRGPVVRQVDHILVESGDPDALFGLFTDTLQFPVAWPMTDSQGYMSGGLGAGDINIELYRHTDREKKPPSKSALARYSGLAFEPYPPYKSLRELKVRHIPHSSPDSHIARLPSGSEEISWITISLPSLSRPGMSIFLYQYNPSFLNVNVRREQMINRLALNNGGPLGFKSVREIVIDTTNYRRDAAEWSKMLGTKTPDGTWRAVTGPGIRLSRSTRDRIQEIVLEVESLDRAKKFLRKEGLLGYASSKSLFLKSSRIQGLRIRLTEKK